MGKNWLSPTLGYLQNHPTQNMYGRELLGDVIPHILIARTADERVDTSVIQLTNTLLSLMAGYGLSHLLNALQTRMQPLTSELSKQWFHLGKSLSIYGLLATIPIANAFIRNWVTTERTGKSSFVDMVGEKNSTQALKQQLDQKTASYKKNILKLLSIGAFSAAVIFGLTQWVIAKKFAFGKFPTILSTIIGLPNGKFEHFAKPKKLLLDKIPLSPVLVWGIPIYVGLFSASRDQFEFKELLLRFATFLTSFFILPRLAKDMMIHRTPPPLKRLLGSAENAAVLTEFIATSVLFAILPPLINIYLTHQRVKKEEDSQIHLLHPVFRQSPNNPFQVFRSG